MWWKQTQTTDNGRFLAVAVKVMAGQYREFAGSGRTEAEAKRNATLTMWRESRRARNLPDDHIVGRSMRSARMPR